MTRRFALSRAEVATTVLAAVLSTLGYVANGYPYLARGVVGDLLGFTVLAAAALLRGARLRHEALLCLAAIGAVLLVGPQWPLELRESTWWAIFATALVAYLILRRRACD